MSLDRDYELFPVQKFNWTVFLLIDKTQFWVFGGGWVQSTTFLGFFSFYDYLVFISLYESLYIRDEETYKTF